MDLQLRCKESQILVNIDQKAVNGGTLGVLVMDLQDSDGLLSLKGSLIDLLRVPIWEFQTSGGSSIDDKIVGHLVQEPSQKGPEFMETAIWTSEFYSQAVQGVPRHRYGVNQVLRFNLADLAAKPEPAARPQEPRCKPCIERNVHPR